MKLKTILMSSVLSIGALGASASFACMAPGDSGEQGIRCMKPTHESGKAGKMHERLQHPMESLEKALALNEDQRTAWSTLQAALFDQASMKAHKPLREGIEAFSKMTAIERMRTMEDGLARHQAELAKKRQAVETFYAILDADQRTVFDAQFMIGKGASMKATERDSKRPMPSAHERLTHERQSH